MLVGMGLERVAAVCFLLQLGLGRGSWGDFDMQLFFGITELRRVGVGWIRRNLGLFWVGQRYTMSSIIF